METQTKITIGINLEDYIMLPQHDLYVAKQASHHGNNWYQVHESLHKEKARMLTIKEFVDFLELLRTGNIKNGLEQKLPEQEIQEIYKKITEKVSPYRAEWLDADFKVINNELYINYSHRTINNQLKSQNSEKLENCIMKDCYVDLFSANKQGLPTKKSEKKDFYYWFPKRDNNSVARFGAGSVRADLICDWDPQDSGAGLGVRVAREK